MKQAPWPPQLVNNCQVSTFCKLNIWIPVMPVNQMIVTQIILQSSLIMINKGFVEGSNVSPSSNRRITTACLFVGYLPNQKRGRIKEDKFNNNDPDQTIFWAPESYFHYLWLEGLLKLVYPFSKSKNFVLTLKFCKVKLTWKEGSWDILQDKISNKWIRLEIGIWVTKMLGFQYPVVWKLPRWRTSNRDPDLPKFGYQLSTNYISLTLCKGSSQKCNVKS